MSQTTPKNHTNPEGDRTKRTPVTLAIVTVGIIAAGALSWFFTNDNNRLTESTEVSKKIVSVPENTQNGATDGAETGTQDVSKILDQEESDAPVASASDGQPSQTAATGSLPTNDRGSKATIQEQAPINDVPNGVEVGTQDVSKVLDQEESNALVSSASDGQPSQTAATGSLPTSDRGSEPEIREQPPINEGTEELPLSDTSGREKDPQSNTATPSVNTEENALEGIQPPQEIERKTEGDFVLPSFDVVTVNPGGDAVLAGRAEPNTEVIVRAGGKVIGTAKSDAKGEWVFIPEAPLAEGTLELDLLTMTPEGAEIKSKDVVVLLVPKRDNIQNANSETGQTLSAEPLVVLMSREEETPSLLLQGKEPLHGLVGPESLTLDIINYDANGQVDFSGKGKPNSRISAYIDNHLVGIATVAPDGTWHLVPTEQLSPGLHTLRIDQIDLLGEVISRLETPFSMALFERPGKGEGLVVVQPGNSLWRIARRLYGRGIQYTTIFGANTDQIRDPALIYPGQIFLVPQGG